jgi:hypothetical protein
MRTVEVTSLEGFALDDPTAGTYLLKLRTNMALAVFVL